MLLRTNLMMQFFIYKRVSLVILIYQTIIITFKLVSISVRLVLLVISSVRLFGSTLLHPQTPDLITIPPILLKANETTRSYRPWSSPRKASPQDWWRSRLHLDSTQINFVIYRIQYLLPRRISLCSVMSWVPWCLTACRYPSTWNCRRCSRGGTTPMLSTLW